MHIAIIGATGLVGSEFLKQTLVNEKVDKVTIISRRPLEDSAKLNQIVLPEMTTQQIEALEINADIFFCGLGTTIKIAKTKENFKKVDLDLIVAFAKLAKKENAKALFVVSAMGSNKNSFVFYNKVKGEMEEAITALGLSSVYILRPGMIAGDRKIKRFGEEFGIQAYFVLEKLLSKKLIYKIGSRVDDIVKYVEKKMFEVEPGTHKISKFF